MQSVCQLPVAYRPDSQQVKQSAGIAGGGTNHKGTKSRRKSEVGGTPTARIFANKN
jgi:hypothetical protein